MKFISTLIVFQFWIISLCNGQYTTLNAHSHNDYEQKEPFFLAWQNHFGSIEADIWEVDGELYVAHNRKDISMERTLDALYINPILKVYKENKGISWNNYPGYFQLLIDIKTSVEPAFSILVEKLKKYPEVFDPGVNRNAVKIVITGNRPEQGDFNKYPAFIFFDGKFNLQYSAGQLKRIALYSENLKKITSWNGEGKLTDEEKTRLKHLIDSVHNLNQKVRFWNAPDHPGAWKALIDVEVDYINTDNINDLADFLNKRNK